MNTVTTLMNMEVAKNPEIMISETMLAWLTLWNRLKQEKHQWN